MNGIWGRNDNISSKMFLSILKAARSDMLPDDNRDYNQYTLENDPEEGFGIVGMLGNSDVVNIRVEVTSYRDCDGDPDDLDWVYEQLPDVWQYIVSFDGRSMYGFASSSNLALGKALQYANGITDMSLLRFRAYGYC